MSIIGTMPVNLLNPLTNFSDEVLLHFMDANEGLGACNNLPRVILSILGLSQHYTKVMVTFKTHVVFILLCPFLFQRFK